MRIESTGADDQSKVWMIDDEIEELIEISRERTHAAFMRGARFE